MRPPPACTPPATAISPVLRTGVAACPSVAEKSARIFPALRTSPVTERGPLDPAENCRSPPAPIANGAPSTRNALL